MSMICRVENFSGSQTEIRKKIGIFPDCDNENAEASAVDNTGQYKDLDNQSIHIEEEFLLQKKIHITAESGIELVVMELSR